MKRARAGTRRPTTHAARRRPSHAHVGAGSRPARCAVVTVSDTRGKEDDRSGDAIQRLLERAGCDVVARAWVRDEVAAIRVAVRAALRSTTTDAVIITGGTGAAPRDVTPEAVEPLYEKTLPGFGERFRAASERQVGAAAWLSRAGAGVVRGRLVVLLPGSTRAVELALTQLLLPELAHVLRLIGRFPNQE